VLNTVMQRSITDGNPFRSFYLRQAQWHGFERPDLALSAHARRLPYYRWITRDWLPDDLSSPVLDIGCGAGQFVYFLTQCGYTSVTGIDVDRAQVELGRALGLNLHNEECLAYLRQSQAEYRLVAFLDVLEHLTDQERYAVLKSLTARLVVGGRVIMSVPNAESPVGLACRYGDVTHETAFTAVSLGQTLSVHDLKLLACADPFPAPIDVRRQLYRYGVLTCRRLEALRLRCLGLSPPKYWGPVLWAVAEKIA
jgi:2-polyprenyl-3-methyl-5-hydroxy-6-metoxy-1,4-benzoquinol methylase